MGYLVSLTAGKYTFIHKETNGCWLLCVSLSAICELDLQLGKNNNANKPFSCGLALLLRENQYIWYALGC